MTLEEIKSLTDTAKAISALDAYITEHPESEQAYIQRGMRHWSLNQRSAAITDYLAAIRLNPDSKAKVLLQSANSILDFYDKDLYNP